MKLTKNTGEMSLENREIIEELEGELNQLREEKKHWDDFWDKIRDDYFHGIPGSKKGRKLLSTDTKGHREKVSFYLKPAHKDMVEQLRDVVPDLLFKYSSELNRLAHLIGIETILEFAKKRDGKTERYKKLWKKIKKVYCYERIQEVDNFLENMEKTYINKNKVINPKVIEEIRENKEKIVNDYMEIVKK